MLGQWNCPARGEPICDGAGMQPRLQRSLAPRARHRNQWSRRRRARSEPGNSIARQVESAMAWTTWTGSTGEDVVVRSDFPDGRTRGHRSGVEGLGRPLRAGFGDRAQPLVVRSGTPAYLPAGVPSEPCGETQGSHQKEGGRNRGPRFFAIPPARRPGTPISDTRDRTPRRRGSRRPAAPARRNGSSWTAGKPGPPGHCACPPGYGAWTPT